MSRVSSYLICVMLLSSSTAAQGCQREHTHTNTHTYIKIKIIFKCTQTHTYTHTHRYRGTHLYSMHIHTHNGTKSVVLLTRFVTYPQTHKQTHSGNEEFLMDVGGSEFTTKVARHTHTRTHTQCTINYAFTLRGYGGIWETRVWNCNCTVIL